ncbi:L-threonylcarbamoyladenylate synthase [Terricaulis sp.]|uniref:L-threonylcarbamoyladenylate synthase n=1 Tax=Terricaulis sp. TaxID=2768686 RepID=UPI003783D143
MSVAKAAEILRAGGLVAFPTETVYGLGADARNAAAVARIFAAKGRPQFNPLIIHVPGLAEAEAHAHLHPAARALAERFWPGPLTIVAPRRADSSVSELACAGLKTVALRAPSHPIARDLLTAFSGPIAAPSANRSGHVSATTAAHVAADLGDAVDLVLDGGDATIGLESTIVAIGSDGQAALLRPGAITRAEIEAVTGPLAAPRAGAVDAPGMLESHYAPRARLRLDADASRAGEAYLAFGAPAPAGGLTLSARGDLVEAAANLYAALRTLDASGADTIAVAPIPGDGLAEAIRDRLARAAAPR